MSKPSKFFNENIQSAGGPRTFAATDPEKYNLYAGLESLSLLVEALAAQTAETNQQVSDIQRKVNTIKRRQE